MSKGSLARNTVFRLARASRRTTIYAQNAATRHMNSTLSVRYKHDGKPDMPSGDLNGAKALITREKAFELGLPRQATIMTSSSDERVILKILSALKRRFCFSNKRFAEVNEQGPQGLVILATPKFVQWLQDDAGFIPSVLRVIGRISNDTATKILPGDGSVEFDVVCACVDGLTPMVEYMSKESSVLEGFSFLHGYTNHTLPGLWDEETSAAYSQDTRSSLTFSGQGDWDSNVTVPLANTLFQTGQLSFLRASKWRSENGGPFVKIKSSNKTHQVINAFDDMESKDVLSYIPGTPLTPARPIVNGLGNIVRTIDFGEDGTGPASRELEESVDKLRARLIRRNPDLIDSTIAVWALVVPAAAVWKDRITSPSALRLSLRKNMSQDRAYTEVFHDYIGYWIAQGATFCRVLSGGGGWGPKQGLLSLDPQKTFKEVEEPQLEFLNGSLEEQQISALGNIAKPGDYIQFFASNLRRNMPSEQRLLYVDPRKRSVVIGTNPSTIDDAPPPVTSTKIKIRHAHFGCASQSGIYLSQKSIETEDDESEKSKSMSKVDLPYSYVYAWMESAVLPK